MQVHRNFVAAAAPTTIAAHGARKFVLVVVLGWTLAGCTSAVRDPGPAQWAQHASTVRDPHAASPSSTTEPTLSSLADVLDHAERNNAGLRAAFERWSAAQQQVPQATTLPDPQVSYAYFLESVETRVGPQRQRFGVSQRLPWFGKLGARGDVAIHAANIAAAQFERERLELRLRVTREWNEYYYLGRAIAITEQNVGLVAHLESVALAQYAAGRAPHAAAIRAQVELGRLEDRLRTLRDQRGSQVARLNADLNRDTLAEIAWPESLSETMLSSTTTQTAAPQLRQLLVVGNPELAAMRAATSRDSAQAEWAGKQAFPDLMLGAEYIDVGPARMPNVPDSGKDAAMLMASINVPLWFGQYRAQSGQARAQRAATQHQLEQLQNRLYADLERAHFEYRDADRRVELYVYTLLPKAQQAFEVIEDAFTAGDASFLDLIDAQRTLLEFELAQERARTDRANRRAQLEALIGADWHSAPMEGDRP